MLIYHSYSGRANIFWISHHTVSKNPYELLFYSFLANWLIFTSVSITWMFGILTTVCIPIACITAIILIFYTDFKYQNKLTLAIILATFSTFSFGSGILTWIIVLPLVLFPNLANSSPVIKNRKWGIGVWFTFLVLNYLLYFYRVPEITHHPSLLDNIQSV